MIKIDEQNAQVIVEENGQEKILPFESQEAFEAVSNAWLRVGWDTKYVYSFSWLGRPIIQLPEDMMRIQEIIYEVQPDVVIETGVAHGGSLIYYSSLFKSMGKGRCVGVDIEIRPHNRKAIEEHALFEYITLIEGSSTAPEIIEQVKAQIKPGEKVLVILDSNHLKDHVDKELELYSPLVSKDSYIVACDGIMAFLEGAPRSDKGWTHDNPKVAAEEFAKNSPNFELVEPEFPFNEGMVKKRVTYWPSCYLKRVS